MHRIHSIYRIGCLVELPVTWLQRFRKRLPETAICAHTLTVVIALTLHGKVWNLGCAGVPRGGTALLFCVYASIYRLVNPHQEDVAVPSSQLCLTHYLISSFLNQRLPRRTFFIVVCDLPGYRILLAVNR